MSFKCTDCNEHWWEDDCTRKYNGGSGYIVCPNCETNVRKVIGPLGEDILNELEKDEPLSKTELSNRIGVDEEIINNSLRHLLDMHYIGPTKNVNYKRGTKRKDYET